MSALPTLEAAPARLVADARNHHLRPGVVSLGQGVVIGVATSAPGQATAVAMGAMVAVSAYASAPAIVLGMLPMLAIAVCYQRLNLFEPNCGGPYVWVARALHPSVGYFVAWSMIVGFMLGSVSNLLPLGPSLLSLFGLDTSGRLGNVLSATIFGLAITAIAAIGIRVTARFQLIIAAIEYAILLVFSVIGFIAVFVRHWPGTMHPSIGWLQLDGIGHKGSLTGAMLISIFLYIGWDAPMYINEESKHRRANPGKAVLIAVGILGPIYAWLFLSLQGVVSPARLQAHADNALPYIAQALVGHSWSRVMVLAIVLSVLGTAQATIVATSRVTYAMGTDRLLPAVFGTVHERFRTPLFASCFWGGLTIVIADLCVLWSSLSSAFDVVLNSAAVAFAVFWTFTALATSWYYRRRLLRSVGDFLLVGILPLFAAATFIWLLYQQIPQFALNARVTLIVIGAIGLVAMAISRYVFHAPFFEIRRDVDQGEVIAR
jgi:amino acid transporter